MTPIQFIQTHFPNSAKAFLDMGTTEDNEPILICVVPPMQMGANLIDPKLSGSVIYHQVMKKAKELEINFRLDLLYSVQDSWTNKQTQAQRN